MNFINHIIFLITLLKYCKYGTTNILFRNFRFVAGPDNYEASKGNSANSCFCSGINSESALCGKKDGLFDVSECQYGAPVLVSWPHFFQVQMFTNESINIHISWLQE